MLSTNVQLDWQRFAPNVNISIRMISTKVQLRESCILSNIFFFQNVGFFKTKNHNNRVILCQTTLCGTLLGNFSVGKWFGNWPLSNKSPHDLVFPNHCLPYIESFLLQISRFLKMLSNLTHLIGRQWEIRRGWGGVMKHSFSIAFS